MLRTMIRRLEYTKKSVEEDPSSYFKPNEYIRHLEIRIERLKDMESEETINMRKDTIKYLENELESLLRIKDLMENGFISNIYYNKLLKDIGAIIQVLEILREEVK